TERLDELCAAEIGQAATETDLDLLLGGTTVGAVLDRAARAITVDPTVIAPHLSGFPTRSNLVLSPLPCTLTEQLVAPLRSVGPADSPVLAKWLMVLSARLSHDGRRAEALVAIEEAVEIRRRLAAANPAAYEPDLASSLNNLSNRLAQVGRHAEALVAIQEAV